MERNLPLVYLGLGANLGECKRTLQKAVLALIRSGFELTAFSPLYRTAPWGKIGQPDYRNAVVEGRWNIAPDAMLEAVLKIEKALGRDRAKEERWGPRTVDIDILAVDGQILDSPTLTLPHPRMAERRFVITPLAALAPHWIHPKTGLTASVMLLNCPDSGELTLEEERWLVS